MTKAIKWLDHNLEEFLLTILLLAMALIMGVQVFSRFALKASLSWTEELTRYLFIWAGFLSVSYCSKRCISIKIEQFVARFSRRTKAIIKVVNHTIEAGEHGARNTDVLYTGGAFRIVHTGSDQDHPEMDHRVQGLTRNECL